MIQISSRLTQAWSDLPSLPRVNLSTFLKVSLVALAAFSSTAALIHSGPLSCQDRLVSIEHDMKASIHTAPVWNKMRNLEWSIACNTTMPHQFYFNKPTKQIFFRDETKNPADRLPPLLIFATLQIESLTYLKHLRELKCELFSNATAYANNYMDSNYQAYITTGDTINRSIRDGDWPLEWTAKSIPSFEAYMNFRHIAPLKEKLKNEWNTSCLLQNNPSIYRRG